MKTYTINEVAKLTGLHKNTLIAWDSLGHLKPMRDYRNWRIYSEEDLEKALVLAETKKRSR